MSRFYVPPELIKEKIVKISGREVHHILDVMRLRKDDEVVFFDGRGSEYTGFIKDIGRSSLSIEITGKRSPGSISALDIALIQAIPKKDKMDYIVEKATELGANRILPTVIARTIVKWDEAKRLAQARRWRKIAVEAAKQCGRVDIPDVNEIAPFKMALDTVKGYNLKIIATLSDETVSLKEAISSFKKGHLAVAIGPEGDFTPEEVDIAVASGFKLVNLGRRVLKSDTAGLAVLAALNYEFQI